MMEKLNIVISESRKTKPDPQQLGFGKYYTDHMFMMNYAPTEGWHNPRIVPYQPIAIDPAAKVLHYGQAIFEGLKAYRTKDNEILLFRPEQNMKRLNISNERLSIPPLDEEFLLDALKQLIALEQEWVPAAEETSLYIRPFVIATEPSLGSSASSQYLFMIILSPVGPYYAEGMHPVKIYVEDHYVRAVKGGVGAAKTAGNYAASLKAQQEASDKGYAQVMWLDGIEKKYIEEVGTMNVFFKINGEVITPALNGSILAGITRDSIIQLLQQMNITVVERRISIQELHDAYTQGKLEEAFGTGTAAVISPIGELRWGENKITINKGETGELAQKLYDTLTGIQYGNLHDPFGWTVKVK